jgi:hypothetical protein
MRKVLFISGQTQDMADTVKKPVVEGFPLKVCTSRLSEQEKIQWVRGSVFQVLHPAELCRIWLQNAKPLRHVQHSRWPGKGVFP